MQSRWAKSPALSIRLQLMPPSCRTVAQSGHLYFQTPPVTEFTSSETAISYLAQDSLPHNLQCCRRHKIYHLINSHLLSHTGFVSSYGNTCDVSENLLVLEMPSNTARYTSYMRNHSRFIVLCKLQSADQKSSQMLTKKAWLQYIIYWWTTWLDLSFER